MKNIAPENLIFLKKSRRHACYPLLYPTITCDTVTGVGRSSATPISTVMSKKVDFMGPPKFFFLHFYTFLRSLITNLMLIPRYLISLSQFLSFYNYSWSATSKTYKCKKKKKILEGPIKSMIAVLCIVIVSFTFFWFIHIVYSWSSADQNCLLWIWIRVATGKIHFYGASKLPQLVLTKHYIIPSTSTM